MTSQAPNPNASGLVRYIWAVAGYLLLVILFGAWVRISGSGAGCGDHWPLCNGEFVPPAPSTKTIVEYTHRLTSGLSGPLALGLVIWVCRRFPSGAGVRLPATLVLVFVLAEGAIGAGLVLRELVTSNASIERAIVISLHLGNTFGLMASISWCAFRADLRRVKRAIILELRRALLVCAAGMVLVAASGAITALGDTLFPVAPYAEGGGWFAHVKGDLAPGAHFLLRLRIWHPVLAVTLAVGLFVALGKLREGDEPVPFAGMATLALGGQLVLGVLSVVLRAPSWLQLLHLGVGQLLWCTVCLVLAGTFARSSSSSSS